MKRAKRRVWAPAGLMLLVLAVTGCATVNRIPDRVSVSSAGWGWVYANTGGISPP